MTLPIFRWSRNLTLLVAVLGLLYAIVQKRTPLGSIGSSGSLQSFKTMFISIVLEALPFILLGVVLSALLQVFVPEAWIRRLIPRNPLLGIVVACVIGIIFPVCECGMIPVVRRLIQKGMPVYAAVVFILTGPIINPVVYAATYMAFRSDPAIAYARMGLAFAVAAVVGLLVYRTVRRNPLRHSAAGLTGEGAEAHSHSGGKLAAMFTHAAEEFFEMGKYLIAGALLAALMQTFVARESLVAVGQSGLLSHLFMMGFAYVLSLCSTSDAFVASSFTGLFTKGSLLTFLVFGPMLDMKSTLMLLSVFKTRFVLLLALLIAVSVPAGALLLEHFQLIR
ncbi:permease [Paenibacillus athensensis]|uniref:Permease n=1 Tax=Paenibacillus athensensis TaxID=1967502 RepID=A0A4Y8Q8H4_9BACL|nr:permease [Paenibacillus athensensis]MCD1260372.1 permease [Paenibacillus athensensis]